MPLLFVNPPPDRPDFIEGMEKAALILDAAIYNPITVNIVVGYGGAFGDLDSQDSAVGGILAPIPVPYPALYTTLWLNDTNSVKGLPLATTLEGREFFTVGTAQAKAFGWLPGDLLIPDGSVDMGKNWSGDGLIAAGLHELTHAMGRLTAPYPIPTALDLFRYSSPGHHIFDTGIPSTASYFSMDGGDTDLADFGQKSDPGDFLNPPWEVQSGDPSSLLTQNDLFNEYGKLTTGPTSLSDVDLKVMDAIGFRDAFSNPFEPQSVLPVSVGGAATLSHQFLWADDPAATADQLTYVLMSGPEHGAILVDGAAAARFTQADIDSGRVQYVENGDNANFHGFTFQLFGPAGNHTQTEPFRIAILDHTAPIVATNNDFTLAEGGHGPINSLFLDTVALDNTPGQIIYQVTAVPEHGALLVGGVEFPLFTQAQIDEGLVGYINNGDGATGDSFSFVAWDAEAEWAAGTFNILVQPVAGTGSAAAQQRGAGDGGGTWQGSVPDGYQIAGIGDFHGNGSSDILLRNPTSGDIGELRSDNEMNFSDIGWAGAGWEVAGTTDVNGDGTTDIVLQFPGSGAIGAFIIDDGHPTWALLGSTAQA